MTAVKNGDQEGARLARDRYRNSIGRQQSQRSPLPTVLLSLFFLLFVGGGLYFGCIFFSILRSFSSGEAVSSPDPSAPLSIPFVSPETGKTPTALTYDAGTEAQGEPQWIGSDRINILLLGVDQRESERGQPARTDTMIILTVDPETKTAGMLSIPRDLWVPIPGYGENKINTAHFFGEAEKPGSGPELARRTVEYNLGVKIHHWARVDFTGFERLIGTLGGITVDVQRPLKDDEYPTEDYGITRIYIPAGLQRMDGPTALRYARSRHADSDFGRTHRQQQVLMAAREEALRLDLLPKLPSMIGLIRESVATDFPLTELAAFAILMRDIDSSSLRSATIEGDMVIDVRGDGTALIPKCERIRQLMDEMFARPGPEGTPAPVRPATVAVHNGTERTGLATAVAEELRQRGIDVVEVANATRNDYRQTLIISYSGDEGKVKELASLLRVEKANIRTNSSTDSDVDILIILGLDARLPLEDAPE